MPANGETAVIQTPVTIPAAVSTRLKEISNFQFKHLTYLYLVLHNFKTTVEKYIVEM
jgi:hypothetical protein